MLITFLNSLLEGEHRILDLTFLDKEQPGEAVDDKSLIYDIYCETSTGERIIVEMQNCYQSYFKNRSIYYLARSVSRQGEPGPNWHYSDVKAVYLIAFLNFMLSDISTDFRTDVGLMDLRRKTPFSDKLRLIFLQLPYFTKETGECVTIFEKMIYVLKNMDVLKRMPWMAQEAVFQKLTSIADVASLNKQERQAYDENLRKYRDTVAVMESQYIKGVADGHAKGRAEGRAETARNMKAGGMSVADIARYTGLAEEDILAL